MRGTLDPLVQQFGGTGKGPLAGPLRAAGGMLLAGEIGGIVGFMGRHVLGQYELALLDPTQGARLLLVTPNLHEAARGMDVALEELLPWVVFHEVTHAVQFNGVPWLREHLAGMLRELLSSVQVNIDPSALLKLPKRRRPAGHVGPGPRRRARHRGRRPRAQGAHRPSPGDDGAHRGPRRARHGRRRRAGPAERREAPRGDGPPPQAPPAAVQAARAPARPRHEDAPVRARQALLRRRRRARRDRRAATARGPRPTGCRRSRSSTTRRRGSAGPSCAW